MTTSLSDPAAVAPAARKRSALDQPIGRTGCLVGTGIWLCVMLLPCFGFWLAMQREVVWRWGELEEERIWVVNENKPKPQVGIGWASTHVFSDDGDVDGPVCTRTRLVLWLWQGGSNETAEYCECYTRADGTLSPTGVTQCP